MKKRDARMCNILQSDCTHRLHKKSQATRTPLSTKRDGLKQPNGLKRF